MEIPGSTLEPERKIVRSPVPYVIFAGLVIGAATIVGFLMADSSPKKRKRSS